MFMTSEPQSHYGNNVTYKGITPRFCYRNSYANNYIIETQRQLFAIIRFELISYLFMIWFIWSIIPCGI